MRLSSHGGCQCQEQLNAPVKRHNDNAYPGHPDRHRDRACHVYCMNLNPSSKGLCSMKSEGFYVMYPWKLTNFPACPYLLPNAWDYRTDKNHRRYGGDTQVWISLGGPLFLHHFQGHRQAEPPCLDLSRSHPALCSVWPSVTFFSTRTIKHGAR